MGPMGPVCRQFLRACILALLGATTAWAQEGARGAGRFELGTFPGGGMLFTKSSETLAPDFSNYTFGASFTWNATERLGVEAEAGFGLGGRETIVFAGQTLTAQAIPDTITYSGNVVIYPVGTRRAFTPYAAAGLGAFSLVKREGVENLGITSSITLFDGDIGGGLKWYSTHRWGLRGDYRLLMIQGSNAAPPFFGQTVRYGHRAYAAVFATF